MKAVVPVEYDDDGVFYPVDMSAKRCTMLAGIFSDGTILKPFIIIIYHVEEELIVEGYIQDVVSFSHNDKGFIDMISFELLAQNVFFPEIFRRR